LLSYETDFDSTDRILCYRLSGRVTDQDLRELYVVGLGHIAELDPRCGILDLSSVSIFEVTSQTARELARSAPTNSDKSRITVIVAPSAHMFGLARLFQIERERTTPNLHVVRTLTEAFEVLGVQEPQFQRVQTT
jgi:hypothetical protein